MALLFGDVRRADSRAARSRPSDAHVLGAIVIGRREERLVAWWALT